MRVVSSHVPAARSRSRAGRALAVLAVGIALVTAACAPSDREEAGGASAALRASTVAARTVVDVATRPPTAAEEALVAARPYTLHAPPVVKDPAPLVVVLHGLGANGAIEAGYLNLAPATDARGMLLAVVDGITDPVGIRFWNATDACCAAEHANVDDSTYLRAVVADVASRYRIDPNRVFLIGHSNGGFMSYRMACDHASVIAGIVSLEAATWNDPGRCRPTESVAVLEIHGTSDETIRYRGGTMNHRRYPSATRTVQTWARNNGCAAVPDLVAPAPRPLEVLLPPPTVTAYSTGCRGNGHVELWTQRRGIHMPALVSTFADQVLDYLLAHPKQ
jgi:polyhydroxybutyrate depolymerase